MPKINIMKLLKAVILSFLIIVIQSCSTAANKERDLLDNEYTAIVLDLCDEFGEYKFRASNTYYFDLNFEKPLETFVFISDFQCGFAGGSCGENLEVYMKNGSTYDIVYNRCGFNFKKLDESNFGINSFTLEVKLYPGGVEPFSKALKVSWDGKNFTETEFKSQINYNES